MCNTVVRRIVRSILKEMNLVCLSGYYITTTREIGINEGNVAAELFNLRNDTKLQIKLVRSLILWLSIHLMTIVIASIFVKLLLVDLSKAWLFFKCSAGIVLDIICGAILLSVYGMFYVPDFLLAMLRHIFDDVYKVDIDNVFEHPSGRKIILPKCVFDCSHGIDLLYKSDNKTRCNVNRILRYHSRN